MATCEILKKSIKKQKESGEEDQNLGTKILKNFFTVKTIHKIIEKAIMMDLLLPWYHI
jgi:hypothetical protein